MKEEKKRKAMESDGKRVDKGRSFFFQPNKIIFSGFVYYSFSSLCSSGDASQGSGAFWGFVGVRFKRSRHRTGVLALDIFLLYTANYSQSDGVAEVGVDLSQYFSQ